MEPEPNPTKKRPRRMRAKYTPRTKLRFVQGVFRSCGGPDARRIKPGDRTLKALKMLPALSFAVGEWDAAGLLGGSCNGLKDAGCTASEKEKLS